MRAQFVITHSGGDLSDVLVTRFGEHQPNVVDESLLLAQEPKARTLISYAHETLSYRVMAGSSTTPVLELFVEPKLAADLRDACQTVISAFATMIVSVVWLAVGIAVFNATSDLVLGAIPALVAGVVAGLVLVLNWKQNKLVWS